MDSSEEGRAMCFPNGYVYSQGVSLLSFIPPRRNKEAHVIFDRTGAEGDGGERPRWFGDLPSVRNDLLAR